MWNGLSWVLINCAQIGWLAGSQPNFNDCSARSGWYVYLASPPAHIYEVSPLKTCPLAIMWNIYTELAMIHIPTVAALLSCNQSPPVTLFGTTNCVQC